MGAGAVGCGMFQAVLFDKDGTLVDFHGTWDAAIADALRATAVDERMLHEAATALGFDLESDTIRPGSVLIAESNDVIFEVVAPILDAQKLFETAFERSMETVAPAAGLPAALQELRAKGVVLGVATNDYESVTTTQLATLGWDGLFDTIVGSDSGYGAKPQPGMIHGALERLATAPADAAMVGDTAHDIEAGRRAGVTTVLVTNGQSPDARTAAEANVVIADLCELPDALSQVGGPD